ncbi:DUF1819 family protein [Roseococcus sp.]|uniref:DUF1819 family protein n=1 Tax=Roseococcus sp. TaxID=2109646 RepID=UPI003BAB445D
MSFATGSLLINESVEVARLHAPGEAWEDTICRALAEGVTSLPKAASRRRTLREIVNRLSCLNEEERQFLVERADRDEHAALLWVATCRAYRFVREYAREVVCERHLSHRLDLPLETFGHLLEAKAEWDAGLAAIAPATAHKLRQILFRMMREASVIDEDKRILTANLSGSLRALLRRTAPADLAVFPGVGLEPI